MFFTDIKARKLFLLYILVWLNLDRSCFEVFLMKKALIQVNSQEKKSIYVSFVVILPHFIDLIFQKSKMSRTSAHGTEILDSY